MGGQFTVTAPQSRPLLQINWAYAELIASKLPRLFKQVKLTWISPDKHSSTCRKRGGELKWCRVTARIASDCERRNEGR